MNIRNPADGSLGTCTDEAYEAFWRYKGWTEVSDDEVRVLGVIAQFSDEPVASLDDLTKDDLARYAEAAGVEVKARDSKDRILDRLRTLATEPAAVETVSPPQTEEV